MVHYGSRCRRDTKLEQLAEDGLLELDFMQEQRGGKPVIYLFPPAGKTMTAHVELDLAPQ